MTVRNSFKAALVAVSVLGLSACGGGEPVDPAMFDAEVQRLADDGDLYGEIFLVLKDTRPALYNEFRTIAVNEFSRGRPTREASFVAGMQMREKFLSEILRLSRVASDENIKEMIAVMIETYTHLNAENPADCVRSIEGLTPEKVEEYPPALRKRELQLIVSLLSDEKTTLNRRAASQKEVLNWMVNMISVEPQVGDMLRLLEAEKRGRADDETICNGMITVYKRLSYKTAEKRGPLFRGMALLALQQQQLQRLENAEDDVAT